MKRTPRRSVGSLLRWIFRHGNHHLVCELTQDISPRRYRLSLVAAWDETQRAVESFDSGMSAFHRHAEMAVTLREFGWKVVGYTGALTLREAA